MNIGDKIPNFIAYDEQGREVRSENLIGKKWVLYFYPKDMTPGCTQQACNIRDNYDELKRNDIIIYGVSMDNHEKHKKFIEKYSLPFPLIVDIDKQLIKMFNVWGPKSFMGKKFDGIIRKTFLINEENIIHSIIEKPKVKNHAEEIILNFNKNNKT